MVIEWGRKGLGGMGDVSWLGSFFCGEGRRGGRW